MSGKKLKVIDEQITSNVITLTTGLNTDNAEAYQLKVTPDNIIIRGASEAGTFYGIQTLRKSLPATNKGDISLPGVEINDYPRFSYRGVHLDVSRHFFPIDSIKRFIDMMALHNINRLHWHLTDDQGWRIEIKKRPELTTIGSKRSATVIGHNSGEYDDVPYSGFYTQDEAKDIVRYAQERHITVIPEIDLPGHMQAALAAYPELGCTGGPYEVWKMWGVSEDVLCAGNDKTLLFIEDVLSEMVDIFPSEYIHVGGDECPKIRWEKCPKCQARIKELRLKADKNHTAEQKLQSYIINYAEQFLNGKGRRIIGWEEILEGGLAPNATVMSWRGIEGGIEAVKHKHDAIMTPSLFLYFDYYQTMDTDNEPPAIGGYVPLEKVYSYEPVPQTLTSETPISKAWVRTYAEIGEEILDLRELSVAISNDGKGYKEIKSEVYPVASKEDRNGIYTHELSFDTVQAHYVKITARPEYDIPTWHWGKGRPAFIFVDEIGLE